MRHRIGRVVVLVAFLGFRGASVFAGMDPHLEPLRPLLGKTWRGELRGSTAAKPIVDVSRFELVLNGQVVRTLHSINDGAYGGESLITWDSTKQMLVYSYFTTDGFYTTGTMRTEDGALLAHEVVHGDAGGIDEVKATFRILPDGRLRVTARHLKEGAWVDGRDTFYVEDAQASVRFKD